MCAGSKSGGIFIGCFRVDHVLLPLSNRCYLQLDTLIVNSKIVTQCTFPHSEVLFI